LPRSSSATDAHLAPVVLAQQTLRSVRISHKAHRRAAAAFDRRATWLGVMTVIVTTVAGTTFFSSGATGNSVALKVVAGALSIGAAVLSALQVALKYGDRCAAHAAAGHAYGILRRDTEELLATVDESVDPGLFHEALKAIRRRWNEVDEGAPHVPQEMYDRVVRKLARTGDATADGTRSGASRVLTILEEQPVA
jgi:hypothetical protein